MVSPLDTAWSILKELSREDLEMAARTGGIPITAARRQALADSPEELPPNLLNTMRPEFYGRPDYRYEQEPPVDMMTPLSSMNHPITEDFGNIIVTPK